MEEVTIAGNLKEMLQNIEMVGADLEMRGRIAAAHHQDFSNDRGGN